MIVIMNNELRKEIERKIAKAVISSALNAGYKISVFDGEEETSILSSCTEILKAMFTTDEDTLYMSFSGNKIGWVKFVYGNDGYDVVSDYTVNLEKIMKVANAISERYAS